jgi:hypothetical protein
MEKTFATQEKAYYAASKRLHTYRDNVKSLGHGYAETVDGVVNVIAISKDRFHDIDMTIVELKPPR